MSISEERIKRKLRLVFVNKEISKDNNNKAQRPIVAQNNDLLN